MKKVLSPGPVPLAVCLEITTWRFAVCGHSRRRLLR